MEKTGRHAVVIGGSIAGLCAARVLADFYDTVRVFDRDNLPDGPANRSTVPQDQHLHLPMPRGAVESDTLFPGLLDEMVARGRHGAEEPRRRRQGVGERSRSGSM
jgi:protoporphyrinogen oxidase